MNAYLKKFVGFSIGPVLGAVISAIMIPLITFFVIPSEYGKATVFLTVQSILTMIITLGFDSAFVSRYNKSKDRVKLNSNCLFVPLLFSIFLIGLSPIYYGFVSSLIFDEVIFLPVFLLALFSLFVVLERFILLSIRMREKAVLYSVLNVLLKMAVFIATFIYIAFIRTDFLAVVYSALLGQMFFDVILVLVFRKEIVFDVRSIEKKEVISLAKFGIPIAVASIVGYLLNSADTFFLKAQSTNEEIGYYAVALKVVGFLAIIQNSFSTFWTPVAFRWYAEEKPIFHFERVGRLLSAVLVVLYFLILSCKDVILFLISEDYAPAIRMIPFLVLYPIIYTIGTTTDLGIQFSRKTNSILFASVISLLVNVLLNYFLVPVFGGVGAALTTGFSYILFFWIKTLLANKYWTKMDVSHFAVTTLVLVFGAAINTFGELGPFVIAINFFLIALALLYYSKDLLAFYRMARRNI